MRLRAKVAGFIREPFIKEGKRGMRSRMIEAGEVFEFEVEKDAKGKPLPIPAWSVPVAEPVAAPAEGDPPKG